MTDSDRYVKTGVFLAPFHATRENPLLALERDMDLLILLDKLNYHEAWIGEHHSSGFEIIACPEMFIAGAAERTRHIGSAPAWSRCPITTRSRSPAA
jgi:limonene 1,2-monooxygenase